VGGVKGLESIPAHKTFMRRTITGLAGVSSPGGSWKLDPERSGPVLMANCTLCTRLPGIRQLELKLCRRQCRYCSHCCINYLMPANGALKEARCTTPSIPPTAM